MKRNEYLETLRRELESRNIEEIEDILSYFEEMISDRVENGESEEEVIVSLGSAKKIVDSLFGSPGKEKQIKYKEPEVLDDIYTGVRKIDLQVNTYNIEFIADDTDAVRVEFDEDEYTSLKITRNNDVLKIEQEDSVKGFDQLFTSLSKLFVGKVSSHRAKIFLPESEILDMHISDVNGDLDIHNIVAGEIFIETINGDMEIERCRCGKMKIKSVNGDADMKDIVLEGSFRGESVNGDFDIDMLKCEDIDIHTVNGDVDILVDGSRRDADIRIHKIMKDTSISGEGKIRLHIDTVSGDIDWDFSR